MCHGHHSPSTSRWCIRKRKQYGESTVIGLLLLLFFIAIIILYEDEPRETDEIYLFKSFAVYNIIAPFIVLHWPVFNGAIFFFITSW